MNNRELNPYAPSTSDNAPILFWRRTWYGFPLISLALTCTGTAFVATGLFFAKIAIVDGDPSFQNQERIYGLLFLFSLTGIIQWISAFLYFRERVRGGLVFLLVSSGASKPATYGRFKTGHLSFDYEFESF